jgi:hypothetical protein
MAAPDAQANLRAEPAAQLLRSPLMARLAYTWTDGTPRVVRMWFHWTGDTGGESNYAAAAGASTSANGG